VATYDLNAQLTLLEKSRRHDPKGDAAIITEILDQTNNVWQDLPWFEANGATFHRVTRRTSLPAGEFRDYNDGVATGASTTETVDEGLAMLEKYAENDKALIELFDNPEVARMQESRAFIEGMGQTFVKTLFNRAATINYGNVAANRKRIDGFPQRTGTLQTDGLVEDAGGSGADTTSMYIVQWGMGKVYMAYPKGSANQGVEHENMGEVTVSRATTASPETKQFQAYRDWFKIHFGLVVQDTRCLARIANLEKSGANSFDEDLLIDVMYRMPNDGEGAVIYCNNRMRAQMHKRLKDKSNVYLSMESAFGQKVLSFLGNPIRNIDQIGITETAIT
jgi:hypothetical protein